MSIRGPSTRRRTLTGPDLAIGSYTAHADGSLTGDLVAGYYHCIGTQITESEGHQWPPPSKGNLIDRGGSFYTSKSFLASPRTLPYSKYSRVYNAFGEFAGIIGNLMPSLPGFRPTPPGTLPIWNTLPFPPTLESSDSDLDKLGATAVDRCKPTHVPEQLGAALLDTLHDGLPAIVGAEFWKNRTKSLLNSGASEYLNAQFGIVPLISDVRGTASQISNSDKLLSQYEKDAGQNVRRRYDFPPFKSETTSYTGDTGILTAANFAYTGLAYPSKVVLQRSVERSQWFSGCFTYHLPIGYDSRNALISLADKANVLLATDLTPDVLWQAEPWSWAIDWFSNMGDVISNLSDYFTDGLVMRYGYMMETTIVTDTYYLEPWAPVFPGVPLVAPIVLVTITKKRRPANPFGFGLSWDGLSPFQLSIAAALGITHLL